MSEVGLEYRVLGPLEVFDGDGRPISIGGPKPRLLLALLLLRRNELVSVDQLVDGLWGESPPSSATTMLHGYVSRLRKALEGNVLETRSGGYALRVQPDELDAARFDRLVDEGARLVAQGKADDGARLLKEALALWRGPPLADLAFEPALQDEIRRLEQVRLDALERRIDADLATGTNAALVPELESLVRQHPFEERLHGQLMLALHRSGRSADALNVYQRLRVRIGDELGLEPSRELADLHSAILRRESALEPPAVATGITSGHRHRRWRSVRFVGSAAVLVLVLAGGLAWIATRHAATGAASAILVQPNSVAVIDPRTNRVVHDVAVGVAPVGPVAAGRFIWTASAPTRTVSRIDTRSQDAATTYGVGLKASALAPGFGSVWASAADGPVVARIDQRYGTLNRAFRVPAGSLPGVLVPVGDGVWFARRSEPLRKLDPRTGSVLRTYNVIANGDALAAGFGSMWVGTAGLGGMARVNITTGKVTLVPFVHSPLAIAAGYGSVWVVAVGDDRVWRIDPFTLAVQGTIEVDRDPSAIAIDRATRSVWVTNSGSGTVSRIDPSRNRVIVTIPTGHRPEGVTVADNRVWVAVRTSSAATAPGERRLARVASITTGSDLGLTAGEDAIWVVERREGRLARIDPKTNRVVKRIWIGPAQEPVAGAGGIWVPAYDSKRLIFVDPARNKVVASVHGPYFAAAVGEGSVWGLFLDSHMLVRVDPRTRQATAHVRLPRSPFGVAAGGGSAWACGGDIDHPMTKGWIARVNARTNHVVAGIAIPRLCRKIAYGFGSAWATVHGGWLYRIDPKTNKIVARIRTSSGGAFSQDYIAFSKNAVWVTNLNNAVDGELVEVDPTTNRPIGRAALLTGPTGLAVGFDSVWVSHFKGARVLRFATG